MEDTKYLECSVDQPIRHDVGRSRDHQFSRSRHATRSSHFRAAGEQCLDIADDMKRDTLCRRRIVSRDVGPQCDEVGNRLEGPDGGHGSFEMVLVLLPGTGFSVGLPQDAIQSLTSSWGMPSPRSSDEMACWMPSPCHSYTSRESLINSAATTSRLRPVLLAN